MYNIKQLNMKKAFTFFVLTGVTCLLFLAFTIKPAPGTQMPEDVGKVLKASCYDCHSKDASSKKGKLALNFDKWEDYKVTKKIGKMEAICEMVSEGKMPPEKYLKSNPDKALTDAQKKMLCEWAKKESDKLMEGN